MPLMLLRRWNVSLQSANRYRWHCGIVRGIATTEVDAVPRGATVLNTGQQTPTPCWREMDPNHWYRIKEPPFWLPALGPAIRLPHQKTGFFVPGQMVRIHLPPAVSPLRTCPTRLSALLILCPG